MVASGAEQVLRSVLLPSLGTLAGIERDVERLPDLRVFDAAGERGGEGVRVGDRA